MERWMFDGLRTELGECIKMMRYAADCVGDAGVKERLLAKADRAQARIDRYCAQAACTAHATETPEERQRKLDEARKRVQQGQLADAYIKRAQQAQATGMDAASPLPPWGGWPGIVQADPMGLDTWECGECGRRDPGQDVRANGGKCPGCYPPATCPDFGAQVSGQLAQQRGIDKAAANDRMRVPTFEEKEAERARMADYFRRSGVL